MTGGGGACAVLADRMPLSWVGSSSSTALAPTRLANDASSSVLTRSDNAAAHLADAQSEREATASQSGKAQGEAPPHHIHTAPVPTNHD